MADRKNSARFSAAEIRKNFKSSIKFPSNMALCTDSREIHTKQIFIPISGKKFDGHQFINNVLSRFDRPIKGLSVFSFCDRKKINKVNKKYRNKLIVVNNTLQAYQKLAGYHRKKINPTVIAITGSSGKTTCKEMIASVLSKQFKTHFTEANFNSEIGVPKTILEMPENTEVLVLELGMRAGGEIKELSKISKPDIAIITNTGTAHIGKLGSEQAIVKAKCEILEYLNKGGLSILPNSQRVLKESSRIWKGKTASFGTENISSILFQGEKTWFTISAGSLVNERYFIKAHGIVYVLNALIAILTGKYLGLSKADIQRGLSQFEIPQGRGNVIELGGEIFLVDESYNANPDSVRAAVLNLSERWNRNHRKFFVMGELAELGKFEKKLLTEISKELKRAGNITVITVGEKLKRLVKGGNIENAKDISEAISILTGQLVPGSVVMIKGSRVAGLEKIREILLKRYSKKQLLLK